MPDNNRITNKPDNSPIPYDDVYRTLLNDCTKLIIPIINEVFVENYTGNEEIELMVNEQFVTREDGGQDKKITDSNFAIIGKERRLYHIECESSENDKTMCIRLFRYDSQIALADSVISNAGVLNVRFPKSAV